MSEFLPDDSAGEVLPQSDRLQILSPEEYELLWGFPRFIQSDRELFFTLTAPERETLEQCRSVRTKIHFLLHLGYFRARQRFFRFDLRAVRDDVDYRFKLQTSEDIEQGAKVLALFVDPSIDGQTRFAEVREQAHALLPPARLRQLCSHLAGEGSLDEGAFEWREVDAIMGKVKRNLRPLLRFLSLQGTSAYARLLETLEIMIEAFKFGEPPDPRQRESIRARAGWENRLGTGGSHRRTGAGRALLRHGRAPGHRHAAVVRRPA